MDCTNSFDDAVNVPSFRGPSQKRQALWAQKTSGKGPTSFDYTSFDDVGVVFNCCKWLARTDHARANFAIAAPHCRTIRSSAIGLVYSQIPYSVAAERRIMISFATSVEMKEK